MSQESHSGPLPSPKVVAGYNEVITNGAERVMVMAEKEQDGRLEDNKAVRDFNARAIKGYNFRGSYAQIAASVLVVGMLYLSYMFSQNGKDELAKTLLQFTIVGVVSVFITGTVTKAISKSKEGPPEAVKTQEE